MRRRIFNWLLSKVTVGDLIYVIKRFMKKHEMKELEIVDLDGQGRKVMSGRIYCRLDKES